MFRNAAIVREIPMESSIIRVTHFLFCLGNETSSLECQRETYHYRKCRNYDIICCKNIFFYESKTHVFTTCMLDIKKKTTRLHVNKQVRYFYTLLSHVRLNVKIIFTVLFRK